MGTVVCRSGAEKVVAVGAIESPEDEKMRETLDVGEAGLEFREDVEDALFIVLDAEAFGYGLGAGEWAANVTDGPGCEHGLAAPLE